MTFTLMLLRAKKPAKKNVFQFHLFSWIFYEFMVCLRLKWIEFLMQKSIELEL